MEAARGSTHLDFEGGSLNLSDELWCVVTLERGAQVIHLGADVRKIIVDRLLAALAPSLHEPMNGAIDGVSVRWVTSLSEKHATLYVGDPPAGKVFFVQNQAGTLLVRIELNDPLIRKWISNLSEDS